MKKAKIIASVAASAALAALPAVGVFADTEQTDSLSVQVTDTCSLSRGETTHSNGDGTSANGTWGTDTTANTLSGTIGGNTVDADFGTSNFSVTCNHATGFTVNPTSEGLKNGSNTIAMSKNVAATSGTLGFGVVPSVPQGSSLTAGTTTSTDTIKASTAVSGATFSVKYSVATAADTPTGTYTGDVKFTLASAS